MNNTYVGVALVLGFMLFGFCQATFLHCGYSCQQSFKRTAIKDLENRGSWSLSFWNDVAKELLEKQEDGL